MNTSAESLQACLLDKGLIDEHTLKRVLKTAAQEQKSVLCYIAQHHLVSSLRLAQLISERFQVPLVDLSSYATDTLPLQLIPFDLMKEYAVVPIRQQETILEIAMVDPLDFRAIEAIQFCTHLTIQVSVIPYHQLYLLFKNINFEKNAKQLQNLENVQNDHHTTITFDVVGEDETVPLIKFVNQMLEYAIRKKASDIHFEVYEQDYRIRMRIDGVLVEVFKPPYFIAKRLGSRLKMMAQLDVTVQGLPQDGRCKIKLSEHYTVDVRVSTCPTVYGEKIVLRLLDHHNQARSLDNIGLNNEQYALFEGMLHCPQGLILVTGPTGSGKTMTLYAALTALNSVEKNILTVEDPIEIQLCGFNQVNVNLKAGLTFARTLRAFLRQDPDVIMVGEIRDLETAKIAVQAAETGHLVFSTVHTNSAHETIMRLKNLGLTHHDLAHSIILITAQRLVRRLCSVCKCRCPITADIQRKFNVPDKAVLFQAQGCSHCVNGYVGRTAVHELLAMKKNKASLNSSQKNIFQTFRKDFFDLQCAALEKVFCGETSLEEVVRVVGFEIN